MAKATQFLSAKMLWRVYKRGQLKFVYVEPIMTCLEMTILKIFCWFGVIDCTGLYTRFHLWYQIWSNAVCDIGNINWFGHRIDELNDWTRIKVGYLTRGWLKVSAFIWLLFMLEISGPTMHSMIIGACRLNKIWDTNPYILSYNVLA